MHTYRKQATNIWQVVFQEQPVGPEWDEEFLAAAFACFLNGGRYSPGEIEPIFPKEEPELEDHIVHPDRPKAFDNDYPIEATQRHR